MFDISSQYLKSVQDAVENDQLKNNFGKFFVKSFEHLNPGTALAHNWHIDCLSEYLTGCFEKKIKRLIINIPFRMLKSSICSVAFPAWGLGKNPSLKFMCVSYADMLSTDLSVRSRQIVESDFYKSIFPNLKLLKDQNQKTRFDTTENGYRYATSTGGGATGLGANFLIIDDYLSAKMARSDQERESALVSFNPIFKTRLNNQNDDVIIVIEQRLHEKDLTGMLLKEEGFEHLCLQGKFEKKKTFHFGNFHKEVEEGELLQEDRLSEKVLADLKTSLGSQDYAAQIQQSPMTAGGNMVKSHWWRRFDLELMKLVKPDTKVVCLDSAYKADQLNDPSAMGCFWIKDEQFDLVDVVCERMEYPELKRRFLAFLDHHKPDFVLIEDKASGQSLIQELRRETGYAIIGIRPEGDKVMRLANGTALIEAGKMGVPIRADWLYDYENELTKFPKSEHDDMCFVADTLIATKRGQIPIQDITLKDQILTPFGFFPVMECGKTRKTKVIERFGLIGTPDHKIFTFNDDFVKMDTINQFSNLSKLSLYNIIKTTLLKLLNSMELNIEEWEEKEDITCLNPKVTRGAGVLRACMLQFMNFIVSRQFKKAFMFITKMVTHLTIALKTWSVFRQRCITKFLKNLILKNKRNILIKYDLSLVLDIKRRKEENGIRKTQRKSLKNSIKYLVYLVKKNLFLKQVLPNFALGNVSGDTVIQKFCLKKNVLYAKSNSNQKSLKPNAVPHLVVIKNGIEKISEKEEKNVYNIKVDKIPLYYANGILVHNCDMTSMFLNWFKNRTAQFEFFTVRL